MGGGASAINHVSETWQNTQYNTQTQTSGSNIVAANAHTEEGLKLLKAAPELWQLRPAVETLQLSAAPTALQLQAPPDTMHLIEGTVSSQNTVTAQIVNKVQNAIQLNAKSNEEGVSKAIIKGMSALVGIETRIRQDSGIASHEGISLEAIHDTYMSYARGEISIETAALAMAENIRAVIQTRALTVSERTQLMQRATLMWTSSPSGVAWKRRRWLWRATSERHSRWGSSWRRR